MKLIRTIRLDPSDTFVFERAAEPGEWAVSGAFCFWNTDPATLEGKARSAFRGETRGFGADYQTISIAAETVQDAQLNYSFNSGALKGLSLYLQVSNIGDEPFAAYNDGDPANRPEKYFEYGKTTLVGFSYKF